MQTINKILLTAAAVLATQMSFANAINPATMPFTDGQTLTVNMSDTDNNRLVVVADQISNVYCPDNVCSLQSMPSDASGAVYVALNTSQPLTMYITTRDGRNFSLQVTPQQIPGTTYYFQPMSAGISSKHFEKDTAYEELLTNTITGMINGQTPDGYGYENCSVKSNCPNVSQKTVYGVIQMTPVTEYVGDEVIGVVYTLKNTASKPITFPASAFNSSGVRAIALSQQTLTKDSTGYLYEVVTNPANGNGE